MVCRIAVAACFLASRPGGPAGEAGQRHAPGRVVQRAEAQLRVGLVVAAQDGGTGFGSLDVSQGSGHRREVFETEGQPLPGLGASPAGEGRLGHDGERPLRADEESSQVRACRRARDRAQAQDLAVRQDRGEPEQHVLDRAEPGGGLPGGRRGDPAADGGDRNRLRVVACGQVASGQFLLEPVAAHPGLHLDRLGFLVDGADAVHPGQIEDDGSRIGLRPAADAGARAPRDDRGAGFRGPGQDRGDLPGAGREEHRDGFGQVVAADPAEQRQRPGIGRALAQRLRVGAYRAVGQAAGQHLQGTHQADSRPAAGLVPVFSRVRLGQR